MSCAVPVWWPVSLSLLTSFVFSELRSGRTQALPPFTFFFPSWERGRSAREPVFPRIAGVGEGPRCTSTLSLSLTPRSIGRLRFWKLIASPADCFSLAGNNCKFGRSGLSVIENNPRAERAIPFPSELRLSSSASLALRAKCITCASGEGIRAVHLYRPRAQRRLLVPFGRFKRNTP